MGYLPVQPDATEGVTKELLSKEGSMPPNYSHLGFSEDAYYAAKGRARKAMIFVAKHGGTMTYTDLARVIDCQRPNPRGPLLFRILREIGEEELRAGRGPLAAVVVHKGGDRMPGAGYFETVPKRDLCVEGKRRHWEQDLRKVHDYWSS